MMAADDDTFNGIPHYETFTVTHWITDHASVRKHWQRIATNVWLQCRDKGDPVVKLSELLEERHLAMIPPNGGLYGDLLVATLRRVRWHEVAEALLAAIKAPRSR